MHARLAFITVALCTLVCVAPSSLHADTLDAVQNAAIRSFIPFNFTNYNGTADVATPPLVFVPYTSQPDSPIGGMVMAMFDLSSYSGKAVDGVGQMTMRVAWSDGNYPVTFSIHPVLSNWTQETVTWESFIGNPTGDFFESVIGPPMDRMTIPGSGWVGDVITFTVSNNVIQSWMDNALNNNGLALVPVDTSGDWSRNGNTRWFTTGAARPAGDKPQLMFTLQSLNNPPNTPTNFTPADGAVNVAPTNSTLSASAFSDPDGDGQSASQWQISTDASFTSGGIAAGWDSGITTTQLTSASVPGGALQLNQRYWWRVRYQDDSSEGTKWSDWSAPTQFDTALNLIDPVVRSAVAMAQIWPANPDQNINPDSGVSFNLVNPVSNGVPAGFIMLKFNLDIFSSYTGIAVQAAGELAASCAWTQENLPPVFHVYPLLAPWDETNVTWNNYIGPDWVAYTNKLGPDLGSEVMGTINMTGRWSDIAADVIQGWIEQPTGNYGLALVPDGTGNTIWRSAPAPTLTFDLSNTNTAPPDQPLNTSPADGAAGVSLTPTLMSSAYSGPGTHAASRWRLATDAGMSDIIWDTGADPSNLVSVTVPSNTLRRSSRYYWDVRHINAEGGKSPYSDATRFDTEVEAGCVNEKAAANAMIKYAGGQQSSNFNGGVETTFWPQGNSNGVLGGIVFARFDLGVLEGLQASTDGRFVMQYSFVDENFGDIFFTCYRVLQPWDESTMTWENSVGLDTTNFWPLLGQSFGSQQAEQNSSSVWTISQATLQEWLDNAATNFGLAIYPDQGNANAFLQTRAAGARAPALEFCIIPEPGAVVALLLAGVALLRTRHG